jgi:ATP-dependent Clp protease ATP-binding subunit ClpC
LLVQQSWSTIVGSHGPAFNIMEMHVLERYGARARRVLTDAQTRAYLSGQTQVGTEHLLLSLVGDTDSIAGRVLSELGVQVEAVLSGLGPRRMVSNPGWLHAPLSTEAKELLAHTVSVADGMGSDTVGTEHLLLGITERPDCRGARLLGGVVPALEQVRAAVVAVIRRRDRDPAESTMVIAASRESAARTVIDSATSGADADKPTELVTGETAASMVLLQMEAMRIALADIAERLSSIERLLSRRAHPGDMAGEG